MTASKRKCIVQEFMDGWSVWQVADANHIEELDVEKAIRDEIMACREAKKRKAKRSR